MQKKYPFIKIDRLKDIKEKEKEAKRKAEIDNIKFIPYNIWFFDKETEEGVIITQVFNQNL